MTITLNGSGTIGGITAGGLPDGTITDADIVSLNGAKLTGSIPAAQMYAGLNATGSAPIYACRAWVNFNGTGTVAIRASGNVSSITDNGAANYTVNFTTAMPDTNYAFLAWARGDAATNVVYGWVSATSTGTKTTSAMQIISGMQQDGITYRSADSPEVNLAIFR